jgi:hypothetical protein
MMVLNTDYLQTAAPPIFFWQNAILPNSDALQDRGEEIYFTL